MDNKIKTLTKEEIDKISALDELRINEIFMDCLFHDDEIDTAKKVMKKCSEECDKGTCDNQICNLDIKCKPIDMITGMTVVFCWERLLGYKDEIAKYLSLLQDEFKESCGGGYTFLNICCDKNGRQWGEQRRGDELVSLGRGLGLCDYCIGRKLWRVLPGGVPYIVVYDKTNNTEKCAKDLQSLYSLLEEES